MTDKPTPANEVAEANLLNNTERAWATENHPDACNTIRAWAQANDWQAVIWTALSSNFAEALHQPSPCRPRSTTSTASLARPGPRPSNTSAVLRQKP